MDKAKQEAKELRETIIDQIAESESELVYISEETLKLIKVGNEPVPETLESFRIYSDNLETVLKSLNIPEIEYCEFNLIQERVPVAVSGVSADTLLSVAILITRKENTYAT